MPGLINRHGHPVARTSRVLLEALEGRYLLSGTGLLGQYFDNADFTAPVVTRTDPTINFNWGTGSPAAAVGADTFSVVWTGRIEAQFTQTYTFHVTSDDGVRLWIDGKLLVNDWTGIGQRTNSGTIQMTAGKQVGIVLEYFEQTGSAGVTLEWQSASQPRQVVPQSRLYSNLHAPGQQSVKIMPIGDSITEGEVGRASYRFWLYQQLLSAGIKPDFVGLRTGVHNGNNPNGQPLYPWFDQDHQSQWGWRIDQMSGVINNAIAQTMPDIVLIHLGTNDLSHGHGAQTALNRLNAFIDQIRGIKPDVKIVVAQIFPRPTILSQQIEYNAGIAQLAATKSQFNSPIVVVDQFTGMSTAADSYDTVHPNEQGERKIANNFHQAIMQLVNAPPYQVGTPPNAPTLTDASVDDLTVSLSWTSVSGVSAYRVFRSDTGGDSWEQIAQVNASTTSMTHTGLDAGARYQYAVRAVANGLESNLSNTRTVATTLTPNEGRDPLLSGGRLRVYGTNLDDQIFVSLKAGDPSQMEVKVNDRTYYFSSSDIELIYVWGGDGNDLIRMNHTPAQGIRIRTVLYGEGGNDSIYGGMQRDRIYGGPGDDYIEGGNGNDIIYGDEGDDTILGGHGKDFIDGGPGNDLLYGNAGWDRLFGGPGNDTLIGDDHRDTLDGGEGENVLMIEGIGVIL